MGLVADSDRGGLTTLSLQTQYRTGERDPVGGFYVPCLSVSRTYSRAVGYFRSTIFLIVGSSVVDFASRGGRIRLVCSPSVTEEDGTARIFRRFGNIVLPPITLQDAIAAGRLVDYEYHIHPVYLTENESAEWKAQTEKIRTEVMRSGPSGLGERVLSDFVKLLLILRSRIAKKAEAKPLLAAEILKSAYREGQHWLVYCEDSDQLSEVSSELNRIGIVPIEYHSSMVGDRKAAMDWFRTFGGVIVSIRCLDEGVDIPAVSHALILASSQNPRQFIQRRGRVLRQSPGKTIAVIHDAIVVPLSLQDDPEQESLLRSEFVRAIEFSDSAINRSAGAQLRGIAISLGIDPGGDTDVGIEEVE